MKKLITLIALATTIYSFGVKANETIDATYWEGMIALRVADDNDFSVWVTIYDEDSYKQSFACFTPGQGRYMSLKNIREKGYFIRAEYKENRDCGGRTERDTRTPTKRSHTDRFDAFINNDGIVQFEGV